MALLSIEFNNGFGFLSIKSAAWDCNSYKIPHKENNMERERLINISMRFVFGFISFLFNWVHIL